MKNKGTFNSIAIAASIVILAIVILLQGSQALGMWQKQYKADAIDGCSQFSSYSSTKIREENGEDLTETNTFPISWMFDECMRNKGVDYTRTDMSGN